MLDVVDERISAAAGFKGRIGKRFSYDLEGGYVNYGNALLDGVVMAEATSVTPARWLPALGYSSYEKAYVSLGWLLDAEHFRFDGSFEYARCYLLIHPNLPPFLALKLSENCMAYSSKRGS